jgi:hypothetical protein
MGKMTPKAIDVVLEAARKVQAGNPDILKPCAEFFDFDIDTRLNDPANWKDLVYPEY